MRVLLQVHGRPCIGGVHIDVWRQVCTVSEQMGKERATLKQHKLGNAQKHMTFKKRHIRSLDVEDTWMRADLLNLPSTHQHTWQGFGPTWDHSKNGDDNAVMGYLNFVNFCLLSFAHLLQSGNQPLKSLTASMYSTLILHFGPTQLRIPIFSSKCWTVLSLAFEPRLESAFLLLLNFRIIFLQALLTNLIKSEPVRLLLTNQPKVDTTSCSSFMTSTYRIATLRRP